MTLLDYPSLFSFFFNDTATTEIYTLSLHDALPISERRRYRETSSTRWCKPPSRARACSGAPPSPRSEEHTSELQSRLHLVCRLLLEKKKKLDIRFEPPVRARSPRNHDAEQGNRPRS